MQCNGKNRLGLYLMVIFIWMHSCSTETKVDDLQKQLNKMEAKQNEQAKPLPLPTQSFK